VLITVQEFRRRTQSDLDAIVDELQFHTGRYGEDEAQAWRQSLPKLAGFLTSPSLQSLHLYFQDRGQLSLEYQLPASGSFADAVLLGAHENKPAAVVVELKDWVTRADRPGKAEGLIERKGIQDLHPSDQVRGYVEYCKYFHSAVQDHNADVHGCVLFTRDYVVHSYIEEPNRKLVSAYPLFTLSNEDLEAKAPAYFGARLVALKTSTRRYPFDFRVIDDPVSMEGALRGAANGRETMRLLSTYSRSWITKSIARAHQLPPSQMDFHEQWTDKEGSKVWSKIWNVVPQGSDDYTQFVQGVAGSQIAIDPLCEVGCPYAVRGFDYDYVGLLWLEDLVWRNGQWVLNLDFVKESGLNDLTRKAKREGGQGSSYNVLLQKVAQAYRILLTRALKGLFVWIKDIETRDHVLRSLERN